MKDLTITLEDRPGRLADLGEATGKAGINVEGMCAPSGGGRAEVHVLVDDAAAAREAGVGRDRSRGGERRARDRRRGPARHYGRGRPQGRRGRGQHRPGLRDLRRREFGDVQHSSRRERMERRRRSRRFRFVPTSRRHRERPARDRAGRPPRARIDLAETPASPWRSRRQRRRVQRTWCSSAPPRCDPRRQLRFAHCDSP
jgi:hypothetical protein